MEEIISETTAVEVAAEGEAVAVKKQRKPINQQKLQDNIWGWAFCAPLIIGTTIFVFVAFILAIVLSFTNYNTYSGPLFTYISEKFSIHSEGAFYWYIKMFTTTDGGMFTDIWKTLFNTVFYMIGIPIGMVLSMVFAVLMSRDIKGGNLFRVIYYIPVVSSTVAVTYTFVNLFKNTGVINHLFGTNIQWLDAWTMSWTPNGDAYWCGGLLMKTVVIIMSVWKGLGGTIILFCAGLSGVNAATKEAASIDGANSWQIFWNVTMPDLAPTIFYTIVTSVIGGMQIYTEPQLLFNASGGVNVMVDGYVALIWYYGMGGAGVNYYAHGCALGMLLFVIILILTLIQFKLDNSND